METDLKSIATDPEDVFHAESSMVDSSPGSGKVVGEGVLGVSGASVDGDMLMVT